MTYSVIASALQAIAIGEGQSLDPDAINASLILFPLVIGGGHLGATLLLAHRAQFLAWSYTLTAVWVLLLAIGPSALFYAAMLPMWILPAYAYQTRKTKNKKECLEN